MAKLGNWTFSKNNGSHLKPEDGYEVVNVFVVAPHSNVPDEYSGKIVIVNAHDENDTAVIQARCVTPKNKESFSDFFHITPFWHKMVFPYHFFWFFH